MSNKIPLMLTSGCLSLLIACLVGCGEDTAPGGAGAPNYTPTTTGAAQYTPTATGAASNTTTATPTSTTDVGISGASFTLNGTPWIPKAFNISGFVSTPAYLQSQTRSPAKYNGWVADTNCGPALFAAIKGWGADTVRFLVSQYFLNLSLNPPPSPPPAYYDPQYFANACSIIHQAREAGLVVEIAMQDEPESGGPMFHGLPTSETLDNWLALDREFGTDRGVMYELYNEPQQEPPGTHTPGTPTPAPTCSAGLTSPPVPSQADWALWLNGGPAYYPPKYTESFTAIGMQPIITALRMNGATNTFVLDGLALATTLNGIPTVSDPTLNRIGYGIHQYLQGGTVGPCDWELNFGNQSESLPIFVDEWFACENTKPGLAGLDSYQPAVDFLNYLREKGIGIGGWAIDTPGYMVNDIPANPNTNPSACNMGWQHPSYYAGFPSAPIGDAGMLIINDFLAGYGRPLTLTDGMTLYNQPPPDYPAIDCST